MIKNIFMILLSLTSFSVSYADSFLPNRDDFLSKEQAQTTYKTFPMQKNPSLEEENPSMNSGPMEMPMPMQQAPVIKSEPIASENFDKKALEFNDEIQKQKELLKSKYEDVNLLYRSQAEEKEYAPLLEEIKKIKENIRGLQEKWKKEFQKENEDDAYGYWDQGEITLSQFIMEYGSTDYLYAIPFELHQIKLQIFSAIPIPRSSWTEMLEVILLHHGIGIKKINPYLRELYSLKHNLGYIEAIIQKQEDLKLVSDSAIVCYIFTPTHPEQAKAVQSFFEKFCDPMQTTVQSVSSKIILIAPKDAIVRLLEVYAAIWNSDEGKQVKIFPLKKVSVKEAETVLNAFFQDSQNKNRPSFFPPMKEDILIVPQSSSIILIGSLALIDRAQKILQKMEEETLSPQEMTVFWYTCKYSDPEELGSVLEKVYDSLGSITLSDTKNVSIGMNKDKPEGINKETKQESPTLAVQPVQVEPGRAIVKNSTKDKNHHFVVDTKTNSIMMVVKQEEVSYLESLVKKLDVPKKMVQIDVIFVEKTMQERKESGINLLHLGSMAKSKTQPGGIYFNDVEKSKSVGILSYILHHSSHHAWANVDLMLNFLLSQNNLHINSTPSVLAINQTPATLSMVEEMSINNGVVESESKLSEPKKSYTRAQYGTFITMTPTIHLDEENPEKSGYVTLQTDVTFDTTQGNNDDKPAVTRRHIKNEVRVADGETIILGGLRRKGGSDEKQRIPFLGEIPGIGKLFGKNSLTDDASEMIIFITPHIIKEPLDEMKKQRLEYLKQRPGDIPSFLEKVEESQKEEKKRFFESSIQLIMDKISS
jgi:general secretion pathway protein D